MLWLIIEIALTVAAWRRGWNGWALIPLPVNWVLSFFVVPMLVDPSEVNLGALPGEVLMVGFGIELATIGALAFMAIKGRNRDNAQTEAVHVPAGPDFQCPCCGLPARTGGAFCVGCGSRL
jgi:hypothetical protein